MMLDVHPCHQNQGVGSSLTVFRGIPHPPKRWGWIATGR
jgi:hypothetical protein